MQGKVALEEHFAIPETIQDSAGFAPEADWPELKARLLDIHERRLKEMDAHGIEMMLLSLNAPTIQAIRDTKQADELSRRANDFLAEQVRRRPERFRGLAALPMQSAELAARELARCVKDLGFCGALVNGFTQVADHDSAVYLDPIGRSGPRWSGSTCRSICIRAIRCRRTLRSMKAIAGCSGQPGGSGRRRRFTRCG
jgi:gamma-resorcylate decarboxylase